MMEEIVQIITKIIENAKAPTVFTNKCMIIVSILESMKEAITNFQPKGEINREKTDQLLKNLDILFESMKAFQKENFFWSICKNGKSFQETIRNINDIMSKINLLLQYIGIQESFSLPGDDLFNDLDELDNFLMDTLTVISQRRLEVEDLFKQIHKARADINRLSTDEENIDELKKYPKYKINKTDFNINPNEIDHNDEFYYYKGVKKDNNQNVTILELRDNRIFKRLLSVLISIEHPYIESFIGSYIEDKQITIVTNRDGFKLKDLLSKENKKLSFKLEPGDMTILAFKIAQAMSYLHSRSVIHRNLNTSHIYITRQINDNEINPLIVGFRDSCLHISEFSTQISELSSQNLSFFRAPELEDSNSIDEKVDVFAFSGILYEMLTGHIPFRNQDSSTISILLRDNKRPELPEDTPENLKNLIDKCWSSEPKDRYSFDKIVHKMIKKKIVFQQDEEKRQMIEKFYEENSIKSMNAQKCLNVFESIKNNIGKTYQYRYEFLRIRPLLNDYHYLLKTSEYSTRDDLDETERESMESLSNNLKTLITIITNQSEDKWSEMLKKSSKSRILMNSFNITEVTKTIKNSMNSISNSMKDLGFVDIKEYVENKDDLVFDYNELQSILEDNLEVVGSNIITQKLNEIQKFRIERNLDESISDDSLRRRIKDLFAPYKEDYEININNYKSNDKYFISELKSDEFDDSNVFLFLLSKEIRYLTRLKHLYISEFVGFSFSEKDKTVYFISKFVSNGSLFHSVITESSLSGDEKTKIAFQIAEAMNYIHQQRILHLDLKTENVLLDGETPKITNFRFNDRKKKCDMKNNAISLGTMNYMAPEILKGDKFDSKADVFSFALLLYEMYSEKPLFSQFGLHGEIMKKKILRGVCLKFDSDVQDELRNLIIDCSQMDSNKRPSFNDIINRMRNENIAFPGANKDLIKSFYASEITKMELESQSHSFI